MEARIGEEEWRDVVGYEGKYRVSSLGRVKSMERSVMVRRLGGEHARNLPGKLLKSTIGKTGYYTVSLCGKNAKLHRVIAEAFIPNPHKKDLINHKNGIRTDNRLDNLEWCTHAENLRHAAHTLKTMNLLHEMRGVECTDTNKAYDSLASAARDTGLKPQNIYHVCRGHWLTCGGLHWRYTDGS